MIHQLDTTDKKLLSVLQTDFPIAERPFAVIGERLGISEDEVLKRIGVLLRDKKIIRQIGAVFDTKRLGYRSCLIACKVDETDCDGTADIINEHPGVSHNYKRECEYPVWFTIAVPPGSDLERNYSALLKSANVKDYLILPALKVYKIGVRFGTGNEITGVKDNNDAAANEEKIGQLPDNEISAVRILQDELPLVKEPFKSIAEKSGILQQELIDMVKRFIRSGVMRRYAALLNHRTAGYRANAMVVWDVDEDRIDECGKVFSGFEAVSHCYKRPVYGEWTYGLYTMVHAQTRELCNGIINEMADRAGISEYRKLYSVKEYKKKRLIYFTKEHKEWEKIHMRDL
ncbi:AsnC family transcriptional regulator [bacterium]|nr:AsnC family transcriptional regulator [bacterium]